jgi:uncharacterized protein
MPMTAMPASDPTAKAPARSCGTCTLCCRLPDIEALDKPANDWCRHCIAHEGCRIYAERPQLCRDFLCLWMTDPQLAEHWEPASSGVMVYRQGRQVTVLVDPDRPDAWRKPPYLSDLQDWATTAEQNGGYVIVFAGDSVVRVRGTAD